MPRIPRRQFLKTASAAAGSLASIAGAQPAAQSGTRREQVRIGTARYTDADYPIRALHPTRIVLSDSFWKPKILTNAAVTIPLLAARGDGRGFSGNVLQAALR